MYIVAYVKGLRAFGLPAIVFPQPGGCTREELPREIITRACSMYRKRFPNSFTLLDNPREAIAVERYTSKETADAVAHHYNR